MSIFQNNIRPRRALQLAMLCLCALSVEAIAAIKVSSQSDGEIPMRPQVFGVHGELLWSRVRIGSGAFNEAYQELGFKLIRLPGGTTANLYLWQVPRFDCKGDISSKKRDRAPNFNTALRKKGRSYDLQDFTTFLKQSGTDFSYVVNVICDTPESTAKLARTFKEAGIELTRVEMGNELSFEEYLPGKDAGKNYIALIEPHIDAVHSVFPNAKIGGVVSTASYRSLRFPDIKAMRSNKHDGRQVVFDEAVASHDAITAFVPHMYSTFGLEPGRFFSFSADQISNEKIFQNAVAHFDHRTEAAIDYLSGLKPDAEVWITEWGVAFWGETRQYALDYNTSHFASLYFVNALNSYALMPSVTVTSYHNFPDFLAIAPGLSGSGSDKRVSLFHAARLMSGLFSSASATVAALGFEGDARIKSGHKDFPGKLDASSGLLVTDGDVQRLVILNKTAQSKDYDLGAYCVEARRCAVESLIHAPSKLGGKDYIVDSQELETGSPLSLPGYSFSVITVSKP